MTSRKPDDRLLSRLQSTLGTLLGVEPVETAQALIEAAGPVSLRRAELLAALHYDLRSDLLVHDPTLGTLGLVHPLGEGDTVTRLVERAAYVRHLALTTLAPDMVERDGKRTLRVPPSGDRPLPMTVELVLVIRPDDSVRRAAIGKELGEVARRVAFLHGVGVNLLEFGPAAGPDDEAGVRRAFCWLLTATRAWFEGAGRPKVTVAGQRFRGLTLTNWRLPGERRLHLHEAARCHLIHGRNGSGKSSLTEALEFAITGRVERLKDDDSDQPAPDRLREVVEFRPHNRPPPAAASIAIEVPAWRFDTRGAEPVRPLASGAPDAASFRLDQPVMERLAGRNDVVRARNLLTAFFPDEIGVRERHRLRREQAVAALRGVPRSLWADLADPVDPDGLPATDALIARTAWAAADSLTVTPEVLRSLFPLPPDQLATLAPLAPALTAAMELTATAAIPMPVAEERIAAAQDAVSRLAGQAPRLLERLEIAIGALEADAMTGWQAKGEATTLDPGEALNEWLEAMVLADLARRQRAILATLRSAREDGWTEPSGSKKGLFRIANLPAVALSELDEQIAQWTELEAERLTRVTGRARQGTEAAPVERPVLTVTQIEALDAVTEWVVPRDGTPERRLGRTIQEAIREDKPLRIQDVVVGDAPGWTRPLLGRLRDLRAALALVTEHHRTAEGQTGTARPAAVRTVHTAFSQLREAEKELGRSLLDRFLPTDGKSVEDPGLLAALNELIALFTPARWAYAEIELARVTKDSGEVLGMRHGGAARADLRLNTAELNLFTVALFLLCAPRIGNPLHLLLLDDPLQNMDEMTATTLARGLAKVTALFEEPWQMILLFHGEDDLERFRQEMPAAVYHLPWLTPSQSAELENDPIEPSGHYDRQLIRPCQQARHLLSIP